MNGFISLFARLPPSMSGLAIGSRGGFIHGVDYNCRMPGVSSRH